MKISTTVVEEYSKKRRNIMAIINEFCGQGNGAEKNSSS